MLTAKLVLIIHYFIPFIWNALPSITEFVFASYFDNFTFDIDTLKFVNITNIELELLGNDKLRNHNSCIIPLHFFIMQYVIFELWIVFILILICLYIFKFYYKLSRKETLQKIWKLEIPILQFIIIIIIIILIRCCIYNCDINKPISRLRYSLINSRRSINMFQSVSINSLIFNLVSFASILCLRFFVKNRIQEEYLRPITIYVFIASILSKITINMFIIFVILRAPHSSCDLRIKSWYNYDTHILGVKNKSPILYNDEYWNFKNSCGPLLLPDLYSLLIALIEIAMWVPFGFKVWDLFKQWQIKHPCLWKNDDNLEFDIPTGYSLNKNITRSQGHWFNSHKIDEKFALLILDIFIHFILCISFNILFLFIAEDIGLWAADNTAYKLSDNIKFNLLKIKTKFEIKHTFIEL